MSSRPINSSGTRKPLASMPANPNFGSFRWIVVEAAAQLAAAQPPPRRPARMSMRGPAPTRRRRSPRPRTRGLSQPAGCSRCAQWAGDACLSHSLSPSRPAAWRLTRPGPGLRPARPDAEGKGPTWLGSVLRPPGPPDTIEPLARNRLRPAAARPGAGSQRADSFRGPVPLAG